MAMVNKPLHFQMLVSVSVKVFMHSLNAYLKATKWFEEPIWPSFPYLEVVSPLTFNLEKNHPSPTKSFGQIQIYLLRKRPSWS